MVCIEAIFRATDGGGKDGCRVGTVGAMLAKILGNALHLVLLVRLVSAERSHIAFR